MIEGICERMLFDLCDGALDHGWPQIRVFPAFIEELQSVLN